MGVNVGLPLWAVLVIGFGILAPIAILAWSVIAEFIDEWRS